MASNSIKKYIAKLKANENWVGDNASSEKSKSTNSDWRSEYIARIKSGAAAKTYDDEQKSKALLRNNPGYVYSKVYGDGTKGKAAASKIETGKGNGYISVWDGDAVKRNNPGYTYLQQAGGGEKLTKGSDAISAGDIEWYKKILRGIDVGLTDFGKSLVSTADVVTSLGDEDGGPLQELWYMFGGDRIAEAAGDNALGIKGLNFKDNPIKAFNKLGEKEIEYRQKRDAAYADNPLYKYSAATSEAAAMMASTLMGGGLATAVDTAALANAARIGQATSKLSQTGAIAQNAIKQFATRPDAQVIFGSSFGSSYDEAKQDGADDLQALVYAALNGAGNAVTELGGVSELGGLQKLPEWVKKAVNKGDKSLLLNYAKSIGEEASEEIIQGILGRGLKSIYSDVPLYDANDENSIINPKAALEEATGAAVVSTLLGLPTTGINAAYRAKQRGETGQRLYGNSQRELVDEGLESERGTKSYELARKYDEKLNSGKQLSGNELYKLAQANEKAQANEGPAVQPVPEAQTNEESPSLPYAALNREQQLSGLRNYVEQRSEMSAPVNTNVSNNEAVSESINNVAAKIDATPEFVSRVYNLNPVASPKAFEMAFDAVYQMGQQGANKESLTKVPVLNRAQAEIAYNMGASTTQAAVDNAVVQGDNVSTQGNNQVSNAVNNTIQEVNNNGVRLRDSSQRLNGQNTEGQIPSVERGTVEAYAGTDSGRQSGYSAAQGKAGQKVVYNGVEQENVYYSGEDTESMKKGRELARSYGYNVQYFEGGNIKDSGGEFRGMVDTESKTVMVRSDHPDISAEQIMRHEMGHAAIAQGDISLDELRSAMLSDLSEKELSSAVEVYRHAYGDTISEAEAFEEMCCDALGKINIFAGTEHDSANYGKVQESFRKHTAEAANKGRAPPKGGVKYSREYENANVNLDIITLANAVKSGEYDSNSFIELGTITKPIAQKIAKVIGIDFTGYKLKLEARQVRHIFAGHGENGTADHSMSNVRNLAKMQFAIEEATNVSYAGKTNAYTVYENGKSRPADTVIYEKDIGSKSYYVVQTAVDTKKKTLYIVTAFIGEKGYKNGDTLSFDDKIPEATPKSATASSPNTNISNTSKNVNEKFSREVKNAEEYFGTTYKVKEAGYICTDGKMLDFSGRHEGAPGGYRTVDHRDITDALGEDYGGEDYSGGMIKFMSEGNIRVSPESGGINLSVAPNKAQRSTLDRYISSFRGEVILDIDRTNGDTIASVEYPKYTHSSVVFKDIDDYFDKGKIPEKFSREPERLNELRRQNRELKKRVDYWKGQTQRTKVKIVRQSDVNRLAREVIDMSESDLKPQDITERLSKLGEHILNEKELRYTDIAEMAQDIAEDVVSNATTIVNEDDGQTHNRLRGYLKRVKLKDDGSAEFESIRNSYKRRIMFDKNGMSVDSAYAELNSMFGEGYFPEDIINPADQLERIAEVLDGTAPQYANPNGYYAEEAAEYMRNYIIDSMLSDQVRQTAPTMADKAAAREAKLKADNAERIKNAVKKERERNEVKLQRFKEGVARLDSKRKETALKNRYRGQIEKNVNTLSKWLLNPDHKNTLKHIPGQLQSTVRDFISAIDFTSSQQLGGGAPTIKDMKYIDSLDRLRRYIADSKVGEDRYSDLDLPPEFETQLADFVSSVNTLARNNKGTYTINDMTSEQLKELSDIVKTMKKAITDMNRLYQNATFQHVYEAGESDIETLREYTKTKAFTSKLASNRLDQAIMWESSRPAHVFKRFGKGGESMYQEFVDGQNTMAFLTKEVIDFAEDTYTTAEVKQWAKETHEFKFGDQRVKLTSAQLMSLYELNKRSQAKQHLNSGGFRVANFKDGKFNLQTDKEKHVFTDTELNEMFGELTDRQKEVADKLQRFMVERGGEWGNYVSRKRFDVEMFKDENYFPIKIDTTETDSKVDEKTDNASLYQLLNMGFTKETSAKANQSIVVYDIFDVFANHMSEMAQYRSFALPLLDMTKWFNIKVRDESGNVTASLRTEMRKAFGSDKNGRGFAEQFVTGIIKAYNGAEGRGDSSVNSRMINRVNRAAVAYNTRVMVQQPSAIVRAALYLDPKDLISSLKNYAGISTKQNIEEMHKHSGIALWKDLGFYDVNVSRGVQELIKHSQGTISKINEIGMKGAEFADKVTWAALWDASKKQVRRETGLSESDAEFFPKVSKVFENVIYNTQVVDTVLTKSEVSRNRSSGARLFTSFMSEPMTTASLVTSEIFDIQMKQAKGIKLKPSDYSRLSKTCIVVAVAAVVNSALASLADAWRDDDEYGTFGQKWTRAMRVKLADELNPLTYFPYASNVWDITKMLLDDADKKWFGVEVYGNGTDIPLTDIINSSLKALKIFREIREKGEDSRYTKFGGYYKVVNVLSKITGIPLYNIAREGVSLYNTFASDKIRPYEPSKEGAVKYAWNDGYLTDDEAIAALQDDAGMDEGEAWLEVEKWKNDTTSNYTKLYDAIDNGGDIKKAVDELTEHGVEEKNIKSSLTRRYKDAYINGDNKEREKIRRALYATGVYGSVNEVIEKCNSWLKK